MKEIYSLIFRSLYKSWYKYNYNNYCNISKIKLFNCIIHRITFEYVSKIIDHMQFHFSRRIDYFDLARGNGGITTMPGQIFYNVCGQSENYLYIIRLLLSTKNISYDDISSALHCAVEFGGHITHVKELLLLGTSSSIHKKYRNKLYLDDELLPMVPFDYKKITMLLSIGTEYGTIFERNEQLNDMQEGHLGLSIHDYYRDHPDHRYDQMIEKYRKNRDYF